MYCTSCGGFPFLYCLANHRCADSFEINDLIIFVFIFKYWFSFVGIDIYVMSSFELLPGIVTEWWKEREVELLWSKRSWSGKREGIIQYRYRWRPLHFSSLALFSLKELNLWNFSVTFGAANRRVYILNDLLLQCRLWSLISTTNSNKLVYFL